MFKPFQWIGVLALVFASTALAQEDKRPPITTDRPSFTTDSNMMTPGEYQLELGYTFSDLEHGDASTFPEAAFRYGWKEDWELRVGWAGYDFGTESGDIAHNTDFGFKWKFKDAGENLWWDKLDAFDMALITTLSLPTGSGSDFDAEVLLGWNYEIDARMSLAGNLGFGIPTDLETGDQFAQGVASVMCSRVVGDVTSVFGELYTNFPAADDESAAFVLQSGVVHRLNDDMQVDFRLGVGLNDEAPDWLFGLGFAYRF